MASNLTVTSLLTFDTDMIKGTSRSVTAIFTVKVVADLFAFKRDPRTTLLILNSIWT